MHVVMNLLNWYNMDIEESELYFNAFASWNYVIFDI